MNVEYVFEWNWDISPFLRCRNIYFLYALWCVSSDRLRHSFFNFTYRAKTDRQALVFPSVLRLLLPEHDSSTRSFPRSGALFASCVMCSFKKTWKLSASKGSLSGSGVPWVERKWSSELRRTSTLWLTLARICQIEGESVFARDGLRDHFVLKQALYQGTNQKGITRGQFIGSGPSTARTSIRKKIIIILEPREPSSAVTACTTRPVQSLESIQTVLLIRTKGAAIPRKWDISRPKRLTPSLSWYVGFQ